MSDYDEESRAVGPVRNPFGGDHTEVRMLGALANAEQQRSIAEVQARMIIARANPRDPQAATEAVLRDCTRPTMAATALYQYGRGGADVSGPSIRLAETIARRWGNIASGIKEISRAAGYSECVAYAWDLESGYYDERQYQVRHWRDTKTGGKALTDERDIYELIANMGQRRKRAVLLAVIPGDVIEAAVQQCEETLNADADTSPQALLRMAKAFGEFGVTQPMIEKRIQRKLEAIRPAQVIQLRKIYASLKDEMSAPEDWFEIEGSGAWAEIKKRHQAVQDQHGKPQPTKADIKRQMEEEKAAEEAPLPDADSAKLQDEFNRIAKEGDEKQKAEKAAQDREAAQKEAAATQMSAAAFDYFLFDAIGELVSDDSYTNPVAWARVYVEQWRKTQQPEAMRDHNADALAEASANDDAARVLAELADAEALSFDAIPLTYGRGGAPGYTAYVKAFNEALAQTKMHTFIDWLAAQQETVSGIASSPIRLAVLKAVAKRAGEIGLPVPQGFGTPLVKTEENAAQVTDDQKKADDPQTDAAPDKDMQRSDAMIAEIWKLATIADLKAYSNAQTTVVPYDRWKNERPDLAERLAKNFKGRQDELRALASAAPQGADE